MTARDSGCLPRTEVRGTPRKRIRRFKPAMGGLNATFCPVDSIGSHGASASSRGSRTRCVGYAAPAANLAERAGRRVVVARELRGIHARLLRSGDGKRQRPRSCTGPAFAHRRSRRSRAEAQGCVVLPHEHLCAHGNKVAMAARILCGVGESGRRRASRTLRAATTVSPR